MRLGLAFSILVAIHPFPSPPESHTHTLSSPLFASVLILIVNRCTHAFPTPNYMTIFDGQDSEQNWRGVFSEFEREYPWESKQRKVVWRGALSEAEWRDALTSVRWRIAKLVHELQSDLYDVGLTGIPTWLTDKIDFNLDEIGGFVKGIKPMSAFQQYIAVLDMDGNSWVRQTSAPAMILCCPSCSFID